MEKFIEVEKYEATQNINMPNLHSHSYYELYFLEKGQRQVLYSNGVVNLYDNCLIVVPPFVMHKTEGSSYVRTLIYLSEDVLNPFTKSVLDNLYNKSFVEINEENKDEFMKILNELLSLSSENELLDTTLYYKKKILLDSLILLLSKIKMEKTNQIKTQNDVPEYILRILNYLENNLSENISISKLAKMQFISTVTLCTNFKKYIHYTIKDYLTLLRINKAKYYLTTTNLSIDKISSLLGFSSANYFSLAFKKQVGVSPLNYKQKNILEN